MNQNFDNIRHRSIGTVEFVSPKEIKVILETDAPLSTSLNTGVPQLFPRVNGILLVPNEAGALIGIITWIGIEYSPYPKRKGYKDFDLVDLPFPLRKLSLSPLGILKEKDGKYEIERGVYSYPSVGDIVIVPSQEQLKAIVQNKDENARIKIGVSPMAANAAVFVDPDKLFGRHLAILGNTGSGKSCSVAGLIRWSIESAKNESANNESVNARFIIFDPNGEYGTCFKELGNVKSYEVKIREEGEAQQLKVPSWMWNSWEWASIAQASARTQRPILRRALREIKNSQNVDIEKDNKIYYLRRYYSSCLIEIKSDLNKGVTAFKGKPGKNDFGKKLKSIINDISKDIENILDDEIKMEFNNVKNKLKGIELNHYKTFTNENNETIEYYEDFEKNDIEEVIKNLSNLLEPLGGILIYEGPDEDSPVFFKNEDFLAHIERLAQQANQQQYLDFFLMRVRSLFTDKRIASVINTETSSEIKFEKWLEEYIGSNDNHPSITIVDLSLLPSEILYLVVSVMARIIFEAHHRYKKQTGQTLPTVLVVDEAHNLIKRYETEDDNISGQRLCTQIFEKIAKEGRKFGVGLVLASQRPSELSQTVLSQCNTFLLHRIVSDRDQEMVKKLVPDTMGGILNELPVLPSRKAILLGWVTPLPVLVEMNELSEEQRPKSKDPEFWNVWINKEERNIDWGPIVYDWQQLKESNERENSNDTP
ncbi:ATP-binding protein [Thermovirga sp.]|uniref:ATP-binding protein n=1 Tax=Thermovirga sp. TaxID=2699834 RepID=UPI0025DE1AA1|nr:ATP-binding protein [Thermovirga sp.]MBO8153485.1 ATP-binding protein [Thermovirga sp.]